MHINSYEEQIKPELTKWQLKMQKRPNFIDRTSKKFQDKINDIIPDKIHDVITGTIKQMVRGVLTGAEYTTTQSIPGASLEEMETAVRKKIEFYKKAGAAEGGIRIIRPTGPKDPLPAGKAGGIFPHASASSCAGD